MSYNQNNQQQQQQQQKDPNAIGKNFVEQYYNVFDNNRSQLQSLFKERSMLTYENEGYQGCRNIMEKLVNGVKYKTISHNVRSMDFQPSGTGGLIIMVTGQLKVDGGDNALLFSEVFHLRPTDQQMSGWWIQNVIFRLNYGS